MVTIDETTREKIQLAEIDIAAILDRTGLKLAYREVRVNGNVVLGEIFLVPSEEDTCLSK